MSVTVQRSAAVAPRITPQRQAVLEVLRESRDHPTAAEVFHRVRLVAPGIGPATVYRSLAMLVEAGHARELSLGQGAVRYDANVARHDHLICQSCGRAVDVDASVPAELLGDLTQTAGRAGFTVTGFDLRIHGRCAECSPATVPADQPSGSRL